MSSISWDGKNIVASYFGSPQSGGTPWAISSFHLHVFGSNIPPQVAGIPEPMSDGSSAWKVWDLPDAFDGTLAEIGSPDGFPEKLCAHIATSGHTLESLDSGNCCPVSQL